MLIGCDLFCCVCIFIYVRLSGISPFRYVSDVMQGVDALIGQFNCLLSFQPRSQGVLSFN